MCALAAALACGWAPRAFARGPSEAPASAPVAAASQPVAPALTSEGLLAQRSLVADPLNYQLMGATFDGGLLWNASTDERFQPVGELWRLTLYCGGSELWIPNLWLYGYLNEDYYHAKDGVIDAATGTAPSLRGIDGGGGFEVAIQLARWLYLVPNLGAGGGGLTYSAHDATGSRTDSGTATGARFEAGLTLVFAGEGMTARFTPIGLQVSFANHVASSGVGAGTILPHDSYALASMIGVSFDVTAIGMGNFIGL
jgi:hypothetical protein